METKQVAVYLIIAGAVILALKFVTEIISFILSDFFLGLGAILVVGGAVILALKFLKKIEMMQKMNRSEESINDCYYN